MTIYEQLSNSGQAFLYVFIAPDAKLNDTIMAKRAEQLAQLKEMYLQDGTYSPAQMLQIIRDGIIAKYNRTPEQILTILFYNYGSTTAAVGEITGSHFDGTNWVDDVTGEVLCESDQVLATKDSNGTVTSTFWTDVQGVIDWIVDIFVKLGISKPATKISNNIPTSNDWSKLNPGANVGTSSADLTSTLPWVIGAAIVYTLFMGDNKKVSKTKSK